MAHMIENNMIAWKNEVPWHGLGVKVDPKATGDEMLITAKLDWEVERRMLAMEGSKKKKGWLQAPMKNYRSIVRGDNDFVFQIATAGYHPMQNKDIVEFFREYCEAGHATMETVGGLKGGRIVWALAKLNGGSNAKIGPGDETLGYVLMATSHDGSVRTIGMPTQVRVVCWNTLRAAFGKYLSSKGQKSPVKANVRAKQAKDDGVFLMKHSRKWTPEIAKEAKERMGMSIEQIQQTNELSVELAKTSIDEKGRLEFIVRLMAGESLLDQAVANTTGKGSKGLLDAILAANDEKDPMNVIGRIGKGMLEAMTNSPGSELPSAKDTMWGMVNGVTYFHDHVRGKNQEQRMYGTWFDTAAKQKQQAFAIALQMAGKA